MIGNIGYIKNKNISEKEQKREKMDEIGVSLKEKDLNQAIMIRADKLNNETLNNFTARKQVVENIIGDIVTKQLFTINLNLRDVNVEEKKMERFVIELVPRLKELGANLAITNNSILSESFIKEMNI
ncbi:MAG: hypothetical protein HFJ50_03720 [Clostridia bacterium]|jgi:hypothetical protein|nr:hypothetical protein [Clostridia bacterium]